MRNIAIFVSGAGSSAERIINLFNEGNRVHTVLVVADKPSEDFIQSISSSDLQIMEVSQENWHEKIPEIEVFLKQKEVKLLVSDNFLLPIPGDMIEAGGRKLTEVTTPENAPREVVAALEADLRKPAPVETKPLETKEEEPTPEQEWADALKINFVPPKLPSSPPPVPEKEESQDETFVSYNEPPKLEPTDTVKRDTNEQKEQEPMPPTYLIWSVLCTVLCCFIPGIVAIIFSAQVSSKYYAGDIEGAKKASRMAEIWIIVSVVVGAVAGAFYLPFMFM